MEKTVKNNDSLSLFEMRKNSGLTAKRIVEIAGTTEQSLRNWEKGVSTPNITFVEKLLAIYNYTYDDLDKSTFYTEEDEARLQKKQKLSL